MPWTRTQKPATRHLTILYVISLSTVALFSILGQVLVQRMLHQQANDTQVISIAEKQTILSQELSKAVLAIQLASDQNERQKHLEELQHVVSAWEISRQELPNLVIRTDVTSAKKIQVQNILTNLEPSSQKMIDAARGLMSVVTAHSTDAKIPNGYVYVRQVLLAEQTFTKGMEAIIWGYNQQAEKRVARLQMIEHMLLGLTLLVLLLEGLLIFRPAVQQIHQTLMALAVSLKQAQDMTHQLSIEQEQSERLLLNVLPKPIAERLKQEDGAIADGFAEVTVLFADIVGFTQLANRLSPQELVALLNQVFSKFDHLAEQHGLEKIKTIGDAYMVVGGLPEVRTDHATAIAQMAIDMQQAIAQFNSETGESFSMRIGINTGPVVAGVIGIKKFIYDLWGDTVNIASRMESHGLPGCIQVTESTYAHLKYQYKFKHRGVIQVKGKGEMETYLLIGTL